MVERLLVAWMSAPLVLGGAALAAVALGHPVIAMWLAAVGLCWAVGCIRIYADVVMHGLRNDR